MSIRIMIVEDEEEIREEYKMLLHDRPTFQLIAETADTEEAVRILESTPVDALILDLELGSESGVLLLDKIRTMDIEKPFIAVVTNVVSKVIYDAVRSMGADYICAKGDSDFSLNVPLSIIEISAPYRRTREQAKAISGKVNKNTMRDVYQRCIEDNLSCMGFSRKMSGMAYCQSAILFMLMSDNMNMSLTKEVYPYVAAQFDTNAANVERNIRLAIEKVWTEQDPRKLKELYPYEWDKSTGRPTNAQFMHNMIKKILRQ